MFEFYAILFSVLGFDALLLVFLVWAFHAKRFAPDRLDSGPSIKVPMSARMRNVAVSSLLSLAAIVGSTYALFGTLFHEAPTSIGRKLLDACAILLVYDFIYYFLHRAMHIKKVMRFVHGVHHRAKNPSALESFYLHPIELLAGLFLLLVATRIFAPVHIHTFGIAFFVYSTLNILVHSGLYFRNPLLRPLSFLAKKHHVHHHDDFSKNYSSLTPLPDLLFRSSG